MEQEVEFRRQNHMSHVRRTLHVARAPITLAIAMLSFNSAATAAEIQMDNADMSVRWDNTFKYSNAFRLKDPSSIQLSDPNLNEGSGNFNKGLISNRLDLLSELDVGYKNFGARVSAAAWYDTVYNHSNDNTQPGFNNALSVPYNEFTTATRDMHGRKAEFLDAYVFGKFDLDGKQATVRLGRHTVLYGESLFFGGNGIAGAQAPVDIIKALSVPGSQVKEILRPVNQVSTQIQLTPEVSAGAYYQFKWEKHRLPGVGSYFSGMDIAGPGAESLLIPGGRLLNVDTQAKNSGQGGMQVRFRPSGANTEFGLYALNYHAKVPWVIPGASTYTFVYPENTRLYGASFSTAVGDANVAGEFSIRDNAPLAAPVFVPVGKTAHGQISSILVIGKSGLWDSASLVGEVAWNRILSVKDNGSQGFLDPLSTRDAWGFRVLFEPSWYQVKPGLDVSMPINLGYSPKGRSAAAPVGVDKGGDITIGLNGEYQKTWKFGLSYTHYFGSEGPLLIAATGYSNSFKQYLRDRDFIAFNIQRSF